jgi:dipeptidyl aminopeptidase/acylaminoacyl peptidase
MEAQVREPNRLTYFESVSDFPAFSPDGSEIAFYSMQGDAIRLWHVAAGGGNPRPWEDTKGSTVDQEIAWSPGGRIIYRSSDIDNFMLFDPVTGHYERLIKSAVRGYIFGPCWSNSGDMVAMFQNVVEGGNQEMRLWILDVESGEFRPIMDAYYYPVGWAAGDKSIFVMDFPSDWSDISSMIIYRLDVESGRLEKHAAIPVPPNELSDVTITPDGRTIVYLRRKKETDIWLVEDLGPGAER